MLYATSGVVHLATMETPSRHKVVFTCFVRRMSQHTMAVSLREPEKSNRPSGANFRCVTPPIDGIANSATARARLGSGNLKDKGSGCGNVVKL